MSIRHNNVAFGAATEHDDSARFDGNAPSSIRTDGKFELEGHEWSGFRSESMIRDSTEVQLKLPR